MDGAELRIGVLTAPGDPVGSVSPLVGMQTEGLAAALHARNCRLLAHEVSVEASGSEGYRAAAAAGKQVAHRWRTAGLLPDVLLCDGFLSAFAAFAVAGRSGARIVLWLGTDALPRDPDLLRLAAAVTRSAAAVFTSSGEIALRLREARVSDRVDVIPPPVDPDLVSEPLPWRLRHDEPVGLGPQAGLVVAVAAPADPPPALQQVLEVIRRTLPTARTVTVAGAEAAGAMDGVDVAVTGLISDGGRSTLRSMARGVVVVSMPRLPDRDLIEHRASGIQATDARGLREALHELDRDVFLREALAQGAVDKIRAHHSTEVVADVLRERLLALLAPVRTLPPQGQPVSVIGPRMGAGEPG